MITVTDNYLEEELFERVQEYCRDNEFQIVTVGDKQFSALSVPERLLDFFKFQGLDIHFSFFRSAYEGFDEDLRVHADNIINGEKVSVAGVFYVNPEEGVTKNGTAFYKHKTHGLKLTDDVSNEEFDRLILEDANDESKWTLTDYISNVPNRFVMYDANYFHSKFPKKIESGVRMVLVIFYKVSEESK